MTENLETNRRKSRKERSLQSVNDFCCNLIASMAMNVAVDCSEVDGIITVNFSGEDRMLLLSNAASLLNCIEYLSNRIFGTGRDEAPAIIVDSDNYRCHRELELKLLAQMASGKVIANKKPLSLQPMVARERKIVHLAVLEIEGVQSRSEGEGDNRNIIIYPS